jgi:hypothetical protein
MFDELVQASAALQDSAGTTRLVPALCGCVQCGTRHMIAGPVLGQCQTCGSDLQVLAPEPEKRQAIVLQRSGASACFPHQT